MRQSRGDSQSLTIPGASRESFDVNRSRHHNRKTQIERLPIIIAHEMGLQIPRGVYPEMSAQGDLPRAT
jgi:hypothetical protein